MKIKYMGKLDPETNPLPTNKLKEGAIRFNEPTDRKKQNIQTSIVTFIIICIMFVPEYLNVLFRDVDSMEELKTMFETIINTDFCTNLIQSLIYESMRQSRKDKSEN